jgi:hypothetical protein
LDTLKLIQCQAGPACAEAVAKAPCAASLRLPWLSGSPIGDAGVEHFVRPPCLCNLVDLGFGGAN